MKKIAITFIAAVLLFTGCGVNGRIVLDPEGAGSAAVSMELSPLLYRYIMELQESIADSDQGPQPLFSEVGIFEAFAKSPEVRLTSVTIPNERTVELLFGFDDLEKVFDEGKEVQVDKVFSLKKQGDQTHLTFYLDAANFSSLLSLMPMEDTTMLETLGPQTDYETSEEEYIDLVYYLFEDILEDEDLETLLRESVIRLALEVRGTIVSHRGGDRQGNTIVYDIPLLTILTLNDPLEYSIVYK